MKKIIALLLAVLCLAALVACGTKTTAPVETDTDTDTDTDVMTHAEFIAAAKDSPVVIETYVQAKQSLYQNNPEASGKDTANVYAQSEDGGYYLYNLDCTGGKYDLLVPGTKIKVTGYKGEWSGEVEVLDGSFEVVAGAAPYIAAATDVTALLGTDELINHMNEFVSFKGLTVEGKMGASADAPAFMYNWDDSGSEGDDLYFNASINGQTYQFTVESYLCDKTSDVYAAVKNLKHGDVVDLEGFLYWYNGMNPHITAVTVK